MWRAKLAVSDVTTTAPLLPPQQRLGKLERPSIELPDGETLKPRAQFAAAIGVSDKTAARLNLPTTYVGCVAYVAVNASLKQIAARVRRRNEPIRRRRR
jgi:hypothetical protein